MAGEIEKLIAEHPVSNWRPYECREVEQMVNDNNWLRRREVHHFVFGVRVMIRVYRQRRTGAWERTA